MTPSDSAARRRAARARLIIAIALLAAPLAGCRGPRGTADDLAPLNPVLLMSPAVVLHVYSTNGTLPPQKAWDRAVARFKACLSGDVFVDGPWEITLPEPDGKDIISRERHATAVPRVGRDNHITVVFLPYASWVHRGLSEGYADRGRVVWYDAKHIEQYSDIVSRETLWEIVLLHELGHAVGVPAGVSHADRTGHCTNHCVMHRKPDLRSVMLFLLHGWPRDFCRACKAEIERAKRASGEEVQDASNGG